MASRDYTTRLYPTMVFAAGENAEYNGAGHIWARAGEGMKISENTIADIISRGDVATAFDIIRALLQQIKSKDVEITQQTETRLKLRTAYTILESDRDRLSRLVEDLKMLCNDNGLSQDAAAIVGNQLNEPASEERTIELE